MTKKIITFITLFIYLFIICGINYTNADNIQTGAGTTATNTGGLNNDYKIDFSNVDQEDFPELKIEISDETNTNDNDENKDNDNKNDGGIGEFQPKTTTHSSGNFRNPPGSFHKRYDLFLDEEFIGIIKANLKVSESFEKMSSSFKSKNKDTKFLEDFYDAIELIKNDRTLSDKERDYFLSKIENGKDFLTWYFKYLVGPINMNEHHGETKLNPGNWQGIFQLVEIGKGIRNTPSGNKRIYYSTITQARKAFKPLKKLSREEYLTQVADLIVYLVVKNNKFVNFYRNIYFPDKAKVNYPEQMMHVINALDLGLNEEEKKDIIKAIIQKDSTKVNSFIQENKEKLYQYNIIKAEDLFIWLEYIKIGGVGIYYNGGGNNMTRRKYCNTNGCSPKMNIFDNSYISTATKYGVCFLSIGNDYGKLDTIHRHDGLVIAFLEFNFPDDYEEKEFSFVSVISKMEEQKSILIKVKCN